MKAIMSLALASVFLCAAPAWAQALKAPEVQSRVDAVVPPDLPAGALPADCVLMVDVDEQGHVVGVNVIQSASLALDQAAVSAMKQWTFLPASRNGLPIASRIRAPFHFAAPPASQPSAASQPASAPLSAPAVAIVAAASQPAPEADVQQTPVSESHTTNFEVAVHGERKAPSHGSADFQIQVGALQAVPHKTASEILKLAPGITLTNEGGEAHADQVFLRGFDAREGQDIEFSVDGVPINESGNLHGNGYADTHFIIPELVTDLHVLEGPFDPRQGNYAVAGSADFTLGLTQRGITAKATYGSFDTERLLFLWGPAQASTHTFVGAELYQTQGFGQNRDGKRGTFIGQYEGSLSKDTTFRLTAQAYIASFHSAGVLRDDDYRSGKVSFYDTYDPLQGEDSGRYSVSGVISTHVGDTIFHNQVYAIARPMNLRENFTGFTEDAQQPLQSPHGQRGDLIELKMMEYTFGARGFVDYKTTLFGLQQEIELGYFGRGDFVQSSQHRIEAATAAPYRTDNDLDSVLGDFGMYADANLHFTRWLSLRGGLRGDIFTYDVRNNCAVHSVDHPSLSTPPGDGSCLSQEGLGQYREPQQEATTVSAALLPRGAVVVGPFEGVSLALSAGQGVRSIDPIYITQDTRTPFATANSYDAGLSLARHLGAFDLSARTSGFLTRVDKDLVFSETEGRNVLGGASSRIGSASSARLGGAFFDVSANYTFVHAYFEGSNLLIPYIPDSVFRLDASLFGDVPYFKIKGTPFHGLFGLGTSYVAPRPLPQSERGDAQFLVDANASLGWRTFELSLACLNLLNSKYRLGEYNYVSNFASGALPNLVPVRHFSAGAPLTLMLSLAVNFGGAQ